MLHKYDCPPFKKFCQKPTVYVEGKGNGELPPEYHWPTAGVGWGAA